MASIARLTASDSISSSIPDATRTTLGSAFLFVFVDSWRRSSHGILDSSAATSIMMSSLLSSTIFDLTSCIFSMGEFRNTAIILDVL
uniref:Uncharacterized protein n=1 Tax=Parascaris univalens TaxID=6257 RepID=A0A915B568_PARUN